MSINLASGPNEIGGWVDSKTSRVPSLNSLSAETLLKNETEVDF